MKKLLPLIAFFLLLFCVRSNAQSQIGISATSFSTATDTAHLHVGDSLNFNYSVVNTGKDTIKTGVVYTQFNVTNSKFSHHTPSFLIDTSFITSIFDPGAKQGLYKRLVLADSLFTNGFNQITLYAYSDNVKSSDSLTLNLNIGPKLVHPVSIDTTNQAYPKDTFKLGDTLKLSFKIRSNYPNRILYFANARIHLLTFSKDTLLTNLSFGTVGRYVNYGDTFTLNVKIPLYDTIFGLGGNEILIYPESNIPSFLPDTFRLFMHVQSRDPAPLKIQPGSVTFDRDTSKLFINDSIGISYNVENLYGIDLDSVQFKTHIKIINSKGTYTLAKALDSVLVSKLFYLASANLSFKIPLLDTIFTLGNNVVVIWPESNTFFRPDTFKIKLTVLNPGISLPIVPNSLLFDKDTTQLRLRDTVILSYLVRNRYGKRIPITLSTRVTILDSSGNNAYTSPLASPLTVSLPFDSAVRLTFPIVLTDSIFHLGNNVVVIWPESNTALKSDSIMTHLRLALSAIQNPSEKLMGVRLYPMPVTSSLNILMEQGQQLKGYAIIDENGRQVSTGIPVANAIDVQSLKPGAYIIRLKSTKEAQSNILFIKQ